MANHRNSFTLIIILFLILTLLVSCSRYTADELNTGDLQIHDIQGCGHVSAYDGIHVAGIEGIVSSKTSKGFYLQDDKPDELDCSSEAIYVFVNSYPEVIPGDRVMVSGLVNEFYPGGEENYNLSITEIEKPEIKILSHNNTIPEAIVIGDGGRKIPGYVIDNDGLTTFDISEDGIDFYESMESMIVQINSGIAVGPRNEFNEVVIIPEDVYGENTTSSAGALIQLENDDNPERIILNMNDNNVEEINVGARLILPVKGILDYSYGNFKVNTFGQVEFIENNHPTESNEYDENYLRVASYNVENLSRFDDNSKFRNIARIIVTSLDAPDIVVLHEIMDDSGIEDDGTVTAEETISKIIDAISNAGGPNYAYIQTDPQNDKDGGIAGGNIRSVVLYRKDKEIQLADENLPNSFQSNPGTIGRSDEAFSGSRKPLVVLFNKGEDRVLFIAVHLTSRGADSPLFGRQQPILRPEENQRIQQAKLIADFVEDYANNDPDTRIVVAGDMNDDAWSQTLMTLTSTTLIDLGTLLPQNERYSYILDGNAIQLDYILTQKVTGARDRFIIHHVNSLNDFSSIKSDHDAVVAYIDLK